MNYTELTIMQASRAKTFSAAQTDAIAAYCQAEHDLKEMQDENAKLRELMRDMWEFGFGCNSGANDAWAWHERMDELEDRMRELGIEVS